MVSYSFSGKPVFVTVGAGGTYTITAYGAQGGSRAGGFGGAGGVGAEVGGNFTFTPGEHLEIVVGGAGGNGPSSGNGGGGGGGSFVLGRGTGDGTGNGSYTPLLVAGGGGGAYNGNGGAGNPSTTGTGGGGAGGNYGGGGGAGVNASGSNGADNASFPAGGFGGSNHVGGYAGGAGSPSFPGGQGGLGGGGGGGGGGATGGGGGGGYTGGGGGGYVVGAIRGTAGAGGSSLDKGTSAFSGSAAAENAANMGNGLVTIAAVCFAAGTLIRTTRGDVAVETLAVGDLLVTASGEARPIKWLGHRVLDCTALDAPHEAWPVRILAGAFGVGACGGELPERDLWLSPGHPVLVGSGPDETLVPIMCLINGTSIARMPVETVIYWHVELDMHDILLAEGLPAESFLDYGNRPWFGSDAEAHLLANPDFIVPGLGARCRPVAIDGPVVEAERARLDAVFAARLVMPCAWPGSDIAVHA